MGIRCVITGLGTVCAVGNNTNDCWNSVIQGKSGIKEVKSVDTEKCYSHLGGEVSCDSLPDTGYDRSVNLCIKAASEAINDARLDKNDAASAGVIIGSCVGGAASIDKFYSELALGKEDNSDIYKMSASSIANNVSAYFNMNGITANIVNACAAGTMSISYACDLICSGCGDVFIAGGTDAFSSLAFAGFHALHALAESSCSPLNKSNGITLGEGSGILVVEEYQHAVNRGARIYCEVSGYGVSSDAYHITAPQPEGIGQMSAIKRAMCSANVKPENIAYINAHGTGTAKNDQAEFLTVHKLFDNTNLSVSSTKSMTGHCLGAAGAIEAVMTVKSVFENTAPPTIGYSDDDLKILKEKAGDIDFIANLARNKTVDTAMSNSFAFGGTNASIIFSKSQKSEKDYKKKRIFVTGHGEILSKADGEKSVFSNLSNDMLNERNVKMGFYRKLDRFSQLQLLSGIDALKNAGIEVSNDNENNIGIVIGTADGPVTEITNFQENVCSKGTTAGSAFAFPNTVYNAAGGHLSIFLGVKGYSATVANGAQAGMQSVCYACSVLEKGDENVVIACGTDENSNNVTELYGRMGLPSDYVLGEGSVSVVLENEDAANKRGASKLAEIKGFASSHNASEYSNKSKNDTSAMEKAILVALKNANISIENVDSVYGCKDGAFFNNAEATVMSKLFPDTTVTEVRKETGDCRAASATYEIVMAAESIANGNSNIAVAVSAGLGGCYSAVVLEKVI